MNDEKDHYLEQTKESQGQKKASNLTFERLISFLSFMTMYPFFNLFTSTLFLSSILALITNHWIIVWLALELNIISFIPIINSTNWHQEQEACLKYLLFQALGSRLLLTSTYISDLFILAPLALLIKLGAAPFHFWFPSVIKRISWFSATLLLTWQKLAPICLLLIANPSQPIFYTFGAIRALVGGVGGLNQTHLRPLLAYSSIGHIGWIIRGSYNSPLISIIYLLFYITLRVAIIITAATTNTFLLKSSKKKHSLQLFLCLAFLLLSLSGIPPFSGFIPKILLLIRIKSFLLALFLIAGSLINLFYYLNFILIALISINTYSSSNFSWSTSHSIIIYLSVTPLPFITVANILL